MRHADHKPLYRHTGVALLRASATPLTSAPDQWPNLTDIASCRAWLDLMWARDGLAAAVRQASPSLADRADDIRAGHAMSDKQVRSATVSAVRYVLRSIGRPTPFGLFAGVAPVTLAEAGQVELRAGHRAAARADAQWLADIITRAESCPQLLERLYVTVNDLTVRRGDRLELPQGTDRARVLCTSAIIAAWQAAATPMRFGDLIDKLANDFTTDRLKVRDSITALLVRPGFLLTSLRAPFTVTDPFTHVLNVLHDADAADLPEIADLLHELDAIHAELRHHNASTTSATEQHQTRTALISHMRTLSPAGRTPIAADLLLDNTIELPNEVAQEIATAASALLRTTRHPAGNPAWREYQAEFTDRYGVGTLVPLLEVVSPDAGLGFPARFHGSLRSAPAVALGQRDERLLAMAWQAIADGSREIVLSHNDLAALTDPDLDERFIPSHVELAARVHCSSVDALNRGEFTLTVAPARSAGTLTSRFTPMATGSGLAEAYRALPAATEGALRAQLSFGPKFVPAENVCRVPAYLDHVIPLGEHRGHDDPSTLIPLEDLAVCATRDRLYLVSRSRRRVVEPQVFHALALDKQPHPLARFLAELPRAFSASWYQFDWGPHVTLPVLPRVRDGRTVLSPAQWRLSTTDLPSEGTGPQGWRELLAAWRTRWNCPDVVELRDAESTLRLSLDEPVHATLRSARQRVAVPRLGRTGPDCPPRRGRRWARQRTRHAPSSTAQRLPPARSPTTGWDGLLEGATGVALALYSATEPAFHWDAGLLLTAPDRNTEYERNGMTTTETQPEDLRSRMVDHIVENSQALSAEVERVLRTVPRHPFVPDASIEDAYANRAITIMPGPPGGRPASCISVPTVVAMMLNQLDARPGQRVLEVGAGTGWNAALLAELVGETGHVSTIDIHPDVTEHAQRALAATGYDRVHVITGDGALGDPENGPFDRVIVTVGPWDLPPAWFDQLAPGGRLVVPLTWRGQTRSVAFVNDNGVLRATDSQLCGFIPMIGDGQNGEQKGEIADDVLLFWDPDQSVDLDALHGVLDTPASTVWSGTSIVAMESTDLIWPMATAIESGTVRFCAGNNAVEAGLANPAFRYSSVALIDGESLAYMTLKNPEFDALDKRWELGAIGHGPAGKQLAERLCTVIRAWGEDRTARPTITAHRVGTPDDALTTGRVIDKQFIRLVVSR